MRRMIDIELLATRVRESGFRGILKDHRRAIASERESVKSAANKKTEGRV